MTNETAQNYFLACEAFFSELIDAHVDKLFINVMKERADKIARDIYITTDEHVTDILKGQLSICYELADGVIQALNARKEKANSGNDGGSLEMP